MEDNLSHNTPVGSFICFGDALEIANRPARQGFYKYKPSCVSGFFSNVGLVSAVACCCFNDDLLGLADKQQIMYGLHSHGHLTTNSENIFCMLRKRQKFRKSKGFQVPLSLFTESLHSLHHFVWLFCYRVTAVQKANKAQPVTTDARVNPVHLDPLDLMA